VKQMRPPASGLTVTTPRPAHRHSADPGLHLAFGLITVADHATMPIRSP